MQPRSDNELLDQSSTTSDKKSNHINVPFTYMFKAYKTILSITYGFKHRCGKCIKTQRDPCSPGEWFLRRRRRMIGSRTVQRHFN